MSKKRVRNNQRDGVDSVAHREQRTTRCQREQRGDNAITNAKVSLTTFTLSQAVKPSRCTTLIALVAHAPAASPIVVSALEERCSRLSSGPALRGAIGPSALPEVESTAL